MSLFSASRLLPLTTLIPLSSSWWWSNCDLDENCHVPYEASQQLSNWSSTHSQNVAKIFEPRNERELSRLLTYYQHQKLKLRPIGTVLSPNGIALPDTGCDAVSVHNFHHIAVDRERNIVRVGAGATVAEVLKELSKYGLTLENFSSIQEQQLAGWTQVAAHGTGCQLSTVEEQILEMKLMTPNAGLLTLSNEHLPNVFKYAKVGLGSLGIVTELTMKCIPQLSLREETVVYNHQSIVSSHYSRLRDYRHVRYMWIPYTDVVVSVISNPSTLPRAVSVIESTGKPAAQELINIAKSSNSLDASKDDFLKSQGFGSLRDLALAVDPLNLQHVIKVNHAEADYWKNAQGVRIDDSTNILGFDCGGEQWVMEVCFPMKTLQDETYDDVNFVKELLAIIEKHQIPAPGPIEQRWTARSTAPMSPAYSENPREIFCWVGIIMYMPLNQSSQQREKIREAFDAYCHALSPLMRKYDAQVHWAKIEIPHGDDERLKEMKERIHRKYPVKEFQELRKALDPQGVLANSMIEKLLD